MTTKIEFRDPPEGYELVADCQAVDGDMLPVKNGWAECFHPNRYYAVLARRKKVGLVELVDTMQDCVERLFEGDREKYDAAERELRARLAALEREPTDEEAMRWCASHGGESWPASRSLQAIKAAREIGQGGDK